MTITGTAVAFNSQPTNLDYLMAPARFQFGDLTGAIFSDTIIRTALVSAISFLQRAWNGKYQTFNSRNVLSPQPSNVPSGYVRVNSLHGLADVPDTLIDGDVFRDPYAVFSTDSDTLIESLDEQAIILAASYLLRKIQLTSNSGEFMSWSTEDIKYSNLGTERGLSNLLDKDLAALNDYLRSKIAKPRKSDFRLVLI
jgi:hypothetical protein